MFEMREEKLYGMDVKLITGKLEDGTVCGVLAPAKGWNGTLILDLDGSAAAYPEDPRNGRYLPLYLWYVQNGYAVGGTTREPVNYRFRLAVEHLVQVRAEFAAYYGEPEYTVITGSSRGGFIARLAPEFRPDIFDGSLMSAGGGGGEVAALNSKLDGKFILKTLVDPESPLKLVGIDNLAYEEIALEELTLKADSTPEGRARLALAAAVEMFPVWASGADPEPAPDDWEEQYRQIFSNWVHAQFTLGTENMERIVGGVFSWNHGTDYTDLLERSGRKAFVEAMYENAGLGAEGLRADLEKLAAAPRIHADPACVAAVEKELTYQGTINVPIMNMDNVGDEIDPCQFKTAYKELLEAKGKGDLLRICWVKSAGHGNFNPRERAAAFSRLMERIKTGEWGDTSPKAMNALAASLDMSKPELPKTKPAPPKPRIGRDGQPYESKLPGRRPPIQPDEPRFGEFEPGEALHTWDVRNWDSYQG